MRVNLVLDHEDHAQADLGDDLARVGAGQLAGFVGRGLEEAAAQEGVVDGQVGDEPPVGHAELAAVLEALQLLEALDEHLALDQPPHSARDLAVAHDAQARQEEVEREPVEEQPHRDHRDRHQRRQRAEAQVVPLVARDEEAHDQREGPADARVGDQHALAHAHLVLGGVVVAVHEGQEHQAHAEADQVHSEEKDHQLQRVPQQVPPRA